MHVKRSFSITRMALATAITFLGCIALGVHAQTTMLLSIPAIQGSPITNLVISSFQFSMTKGTGSTNPVFQALAVIKTTDISSPALLLNCAEGTVFPQALVTLTDQRQGFVYFTVSIGNVAISSLSSASGSGQISPTDQLQLSFTNVQITYQQLDANGNPVGSPVTHGYNLNTGTGS